MAVLECKEAQVFVGRNQNDVQADVNKVTCSQDKACEDGDTKHHCSKRSIVGPSKEDPKLFLGCVWCPCPKDIPEKRETKVRSSQARAPRSRKTRR